MLLKKINLEDQLKKEKVKHSSSSNTLIDQFYHILEEEHKTSTRIREKTIKKNQGNYNHFIIDLLETDKIYHIDQIKKICIDYRLRFLDSSYFKGEIPKEAFLKINKLEQEHKTTLKNFKIIAPSKLFKLEDKDDPLLFASIGNNYYYLIHQWGNDMSAYRKLLMLPFKNIINLLLVIMALSYCMTLLVPSGLFSKSASNAQFWILCFFMFKTIMAITIFYGFSKGKNFTPAIWNSKFI
ncbi:hypothetical protein [Cellulophaga sp. L1A9]|uniref:hypothetical protein n=1 Tax=Cellulophaga sp. L1A9 TaxID=2686362 RepID=UPI00131A9189|nr:hypothetical protein [Cellulophaga sp. L1A9]